MKKSLLAILVVLLAGAIGVGAYLYSTGYFDKAMEKETTIIEPITSDDEYVATLGNLVSEYADAYVQLVLIFNTDPERVDFETWQSWVSENIEKWEKIEKNAEIIMEYLDSQEDSAPGFSFINTAKAQSFMPDKIEFDPESVLPPQQDQNQFILPLVDYEGQEDEATEVQFIDPAQNIYYQTIKAADEAPKGQRLKTIVEKLGLKDARAAAALLEKARNFETKRWENIADARGFLSSGSETIKNTSFATVAVVGVVVTGGQVLTASTTAAKVWAGVNVAFGGADLVLQAGEGVSNIIDNRKGATYFKQGRENLKSINTVLGFAGLKSSVTGSNLITVYGYGEAAVNFVDETNKTREGTEITPEKQLFMTDFSGGNREVSLSYDGNFTHPYENNPEMLMASLEALFPKDAVLKIDDTYIRIGDLVEEDQPEPVTTVPQEQEVKESGFSGSYVFIDPTTGIKTVGNLNFQIVERGDIMGSSALTIDGAVTMRGLTTTVSGSGSAPITGSYDNVKNQIYMGGNYSLSTVSTTSGQSQGLSDSGTLVFEGTMSEFNAFSGTVTLQSGTGATLTAQWNAHKSN